MLKRSDSRRANTVTDSWSDKCLLKRIALGDSDAFKVLYQRHRERILNFLTTLVENRTLAEDVLNEVFIAVWRNAGRFEGRSQPLTWLMSIARNQAISALRKQREVTGIFDEVTHNLADGADGPEAEVDKSVHADLIQRCIGKLSPAHRTIVELIYYQDCSVSEAANILAVPPNTVKTRMFYARKKLGGLLAEVGIADGAIAA